MILINENVEIDNEKKKREMLMEDRFVLVI